MHRWTKQLYNNQSTTSVSMSSPYTEYSPTPSPHMMLESQQNEIPYTSKNSRQLQTSMKIDIFSIHNLFKYIYIFKFLLKVKSFNFVLTS